jgi:O-antigen ligase
MTSLDKRNSPFVFRFIEKVSEILKKEAPFWPLHLFCLCLGAALFGEGYAALPVVVLFCWMLVKIRGCKGMMTRVFRGDPNFFIWLFFAVFLLFVVISDVVNGGKWTHLEGGLYSLAIGFFLVTGALVAISHPHEKVVATYAGWIACWTVLLLFLLEMRYAGASRYNHGVFSNPNILFSAVAMAGVVNLAFFMELPLRVRALKWVFPACAVWAASGVIRYSNSEALLPVLIAASVILTVSSRNGKSMVVLAFALFLTAFYCSFDETILKSLGSVDFVSVDFWRRLLNQREAVWTVTARMISQYPLLGVGSGRFPEISTEILLANPEIKLRVHHYMHSHSLWVRHMAVHGLIAGTAFIGLLLSAARRVLYSYKKEKVLAFPLALLGLLLVYFLYGLVECAPFFEELIPLVWGSLGLLMGMDYTYPVDANE